MTTAGDHTLYAQWGYGVTVSGVAVTENNCDKVCEDIFNRGGVVSYDPVTNTLTLNDVYLVGGSDGVGVIHVEDGSPAAEKDLTIHLSGMNTIINTASGTLDNVYGIYTTGALTFTGDGDDSLKISTEDKSARYNNYAIRSNGQISIKDNCRVEALAGPSEGESIGVSCASNIIRVAEGILVASGSTKAVDASAIYQGATGTTSAILYGSDNRSTDLSSTYIRAELS